MKNRKKFDEELNRWRKLCEQLFGPSDELGVEEAEDLLAAAGIDTKMLKESMYEKLSEQARNLRTAGKVLPPLLEEALEDLRPEWAPARSTEELRIQAKTNLSSFLKPEKVLGAMGQLSFAYRNKKDLSESDRQFLDQLAKKLEEQMKMPGEDK